MKQKVLVVDDDSAILEVLEMRLTAMGFHVTATSDPRKALEATEAGRFDLALLDLRMEPTDGMRLMEAVHERQPRLPVLIMTAHGTIQTAVEAVRRGAFDYLTKPFVRDELRSKIARTLATRRWARDRERLLTVGQALASSGVMTRVLDAVAQATVEATDADRCVVFQLEQGRLVPMASAGSPPPSWSKLEAAASAAMDKGVPIATSGPAEGGDGCTIVAAPLVVQRGPAGALVIETAARLEPGDDDLELLALFSSQAAIAIRNTHDLESLKSGAVAALGRMATQVAHEVKNPLAGLRLYVRHLEQRLLKTGDAEARELAGKIAVTVDHLTSVVAEITAFGRPPELHRVPTTLHPLLDECLELARARRPTDGVEIVTAYDPSCPEARLDARELKKAFLNLILNALEALEGAGRLTVATAYAAATGTVTVTIEDTGPGMTEETLARAFDLFFTTKPDGTGLGMSIARSVINLHAGELTVSSRVGEGTRVQARLPLEPASDPARVSDARA
ncbi:MAG TPA: response regulator [Candidatus Binatia bacterium]|nr:response regulator [Candidatus Binatia bacterium]